MLIYEFDDFKIEHVPQERNARANILLKLARTKKTGQHRKVIQETISQPSIESEDRILAIEEHDREWMALIWDYLVNDTLPEDAKEAWKVGMLGRSGCKRPLSQWYQETCIKIFLLGLNLAGMIFLIVGGECVLFLGRRGRR